MNENKELSNHVHAIGEWASENKNRVAFVVCGEITDGGIETTNSLVGRNDRIARALFGNAHENESFKSVILLASEAIKNPIAGMLLCVESGKDGNCEGQKSNSVASALENLVDVLKEQIRKDD